MINFEICTIGYLLDIQVNRGGELCHIEALGGQLDQVSNRKAGEPEPVVRLYSEQRLSPTNSTPTLSVSGSCSSSPCLWLLYWVAAISTLVSWNVFGCFIPHEGELEQNIETHQIVLNKSTCRVFFFLCIFHTFRSAEILNWLSSSLI